MKLQLDTTAKTIKISEKVNLSEFMEMIKQILPGETWKEYSIEVTTIFEWSNPWIIQPYTTPVNPYPWSPIYCSLGQPVVAPGSTSIGFTTRENESAYPSGEISNSIGDTFITTIGYPAGTTTSPTIETKHIFNIEVSK